MTTSISVARRRPRPVGWSASTEVSSVMVKTKTRSKKSSRVETLTSSSCPAGSDIAGSIGDARLRRLGGAGVALALLLGTAPLAAGVAMVGPHATGGFHSHRLGRATVWRVSAPHLRL